MAYAEKYILSFISERGNDYKISILQQGYSGSAVSKKLGVAPVLSVESGDGRIQGSSLAFSIQSDTEGELRGLYTTNNKEYKALLYRNGVLYWQGYLLPELYSENYVYPPYDVDVTATDQLATLKDVAYAGEDAQTSLLDIIKNILSHTQINIQCKVHMNLNDSYGISVLRGSYISAATYNGQSCYDALNAILLSCNCSIMQMGNTWLITSFTDHSYSYDLEGNEVLETHATIGQMYQADVWPSGSLNMVNAPALKGAKVDYNHTLRNSFLKNADITSRESWMYTPDPKDDGRFPGILEASDGKQYKCFFWLLYQKNISSDSSLQLWQDVRLTQDPGQVYSISIKYLFSIAADLLLLSVTYYGDNGQTYRLTGEGWITNFSNSNLSSYIQVTGKQQNVPYIWDVADMSKYETATVQFELPATSGNIRIGFINSTADYAAPTNRPSSINLTQVYFTVSSITGQTATTEVEKMATSAQEELELGYGDKASTVNGDQLVLNTLRDAGGAAKSVWYLSGREFPSYYMAMLQEYSRYYGTKKMQLQGVVMGKNAFRAFYIDTFSGMVMRMLSGQYNLLEDEVSISLEEVVTAYVDYDTVVYATDNKPQQNTSSSASAVVSGGGATTLGGLLNVDDNVDEVDTEAQVIVKDVDSKVWIKKAISEINFNEKKLSDYLVTNSYLKKDTADGLYTPIDAYNTHISDYNSFKNTTNDRLVALESLWAIDEENNALYPQNNRGIWSYDFITAGGKANSGSSSGGLIQTVYDYNNLGGNFNNNNLTDTFNAYAINSIYNEVQELKKSAGSAFNETALWQSLAKVDATKVIDSSHIPDLSGKYLSLSGGTIKSANADVLRVDTTHHRQNAFLLLHNGDMTTQLGYVVGAGSYIYDYSTGIHLGIDTNGAAYCGTSLDVSSNNHHLLIHSGNITSQSVNRLISPYSYEGGTSIYNNTTPESLFGNSYTFSAMMGGCAAFNGWATVLNFTGYKQYGGVQLAVYYNNTTPRMALRNFTQTSMKFTDWREIAFLDSNVASATKLQTARAIWGQSFDGTGNIWGRLEMHLPDNWNYVTFISPTSNGLTIETLESGVAYKNIILSPNGGNVLIGTVTDAGTKLYVNGAVRFDGQTRINSSMRFYGKTNLSSDMYIDNQSVGGLNFAWSDGVSRFFIGDKVGIGTTNPQYKLDVNGTLNAEATTVASLETPEVFISDRLWMEDSAITWLNSFGTQTAYITQNSTANAYTFWTKAGLTISSDATVGFTINTTTSARAIKPMSDESYNLGDSSLKWGSVYAYNGYFATEVSTDVLYANYVEVSGNIFADGQVLGGQASDRRLKNNIVPMKDTVAYNVLKSLNPVTFEWNSIANQLGKLSGVSDGFIADEFEAIIPNSGRSIWTNYRAINYERTAGYLVKGWQMHETRLERLERENKELNNKVVKLENELNQYRRA